VEVAPVGEPAFRTNGKFKRVGFAIRNTNCQAANRNNGQKKHPHELHGGVALPGCITRMTRQQPLYFQSLPSFLQFLLTGLPVHRRQFLRVP
jgi:hypothetical protein